MSEFGKVEPTLGEIEAHETPIAEAPVPIADAGIVPKPEVAPETISEIAPETKDEPEIEFLDDEMPTMRLNKKRLAVFLLILAAIIAALVFFAENIFSEKSDEESEMEKIIEIKNQPANPYIDDNEDQNKFLKDNPDAKTKNVNVFQFDINACLQKYDEAQCVDMFDKNLIITEKK